jgi:hypothetical protein
LFTTQRHYNEIAGRADSDPVKINVAETKRVIACFFDVLNECPAGETLRVIAKGLRRAGGRKQQVANPGGS